MRIRGLWVVAAALVAAGIARIATGRNQDLARGLLVGGLLYAVVHLVIEWRSRR